MFKRISDKKIRKLNFPHDPYARAYICRGFAEECCNIILDAQLESCEKEHDEAMLEIFREIEAHDIGASPLPAWYVKLKEKYPTKDIGK